MDYPALVICKDVYSIYKSFRGKGVVVNEVFNVEDLRGFMSRYSNVITPNIIVLSDIHQLGEYKARILKFVEEQKSSVVCISSSDDIPRVLMSRFMTVLKYPEIIENEADSFSYIQSMLPEEGEVDLGYNVPEDVLLRYCPSGSERAFYLNKSNITSKKKVLSIIFGGIE